MTGYVKPQTTYDPSGVHDDDGLKAADLLLTSRVAEKIQKHYPGHAWLIEVSHKQGVVMLSIPLFMGRYKFILHIQNLKSDPMMTSVMRAAGEILERYKIPRNAFGLDHFLSALEGIPVSRRGHHGVLAK